MTTRIALLAIALLPTGCVFCVTTRMWNSVDVDPVEIVGSSIDEHRVLRMAVAYSDGRTWAVSADLGEDGRRERGSLIPVYRARCDGLMEEPLPASAAKIVLSLSNSLGGPDPEIHRVWVRAGGYVAYVDLPSWPDWYSGDTYLALVASPFTVAFDLLVSPVYVLWLVMTVGGHGDPWLPWFR